LKRDDWLLTEVYAMPGVAPIGGEGELTVELRPTDLRRDEHERPGHPN
jgi:hypothetical protein